MKANLGDPCLLFIKNAFGFSTKKIIQACGKEGNPCGSAKQIMACFECLLNVNL